MNTIDKIESNIKIKTAPIVEDITNETIRAMAKHMPMNSFHEAYAVILEEVDEFWDEVKKKNPDKEKIREELVQIGAMAVRAIAELCIIEQ